MNYLEMLDEYRNTLIRTRRAENQLESLEDCSISSGTACCVHTSGSRTTDRTAQLAVNRADCEWKVKALQERKTKLKEQIMHVIQESDKPDLMKALYWRNVYRVKWDDICERLEYPYTCVALRQAASRYTRQYRCLEDDWNSDKWKEVC